MVFGVVVLGNSQFSDSNRFIPFLFHFPLTQRVTPCPVNTNTFINYPTVILVTYLFVIRMLDILVWKNNCVWEIRCVSSSLIVFVFSCVLSSVSYTHLTLPTKA